MKQMLSVCFVVSLFTAGAQAGPVEDAIMAAMRLSEEPNYSWVATVSDDARTYDIHGKTVRGGFTRVKMPVINAVRRQLGRSVTDTAIELIFLGNVACVIETDRGWKRPDELRPSDFADRGSTHLAGSAGAWPPLGGYPPLTRSRRGSTRGSGSSRGKASAQRDYSNLQLALSHPHEELGVIVGSHQDLTVEGEIASGTLSDLGAQLLLVRDGQETITPLRATGTFKLWVRGGTVTKYQVRLEGTLDVALPSGRRQINVQQATHTILFDVGTTQFEVPSQARAKLGA